jgi:cyclin B
MREIAVDKLVCIYQAFKNFRLVLQLDTLYLSVSLLDRFLSLKQINHEKLPLLYITCFYVASKFEDTVYPHIDDLLKLEPRAGKKEDVLVMEKILLDKLKFSLGAPTIYAFLRRYVQVCEASPEIGLTCRFLCEFSMYSLTISTHCTPSMIAAASVAHALRIAKQRPWSATLAYYTGYSYDDLRPCMLEMRELVKRAPIMKHRMAFEKYSSATYNQVAINALQNI